MRLRPLAVSVLSLLAIGCGEKAQKPSFPPPAPDGVVAKIGAVAPGPRRGAELVRLSIDPSSGPRKIEIAPGVLLTIPEGALTAPAELVVAEAVEAPPCPWPDATFGPVFEITLGDVHEPAVPLLLELPYPPVLPEGADPTKHLSVVYFDPRTGAWNDYSIEVDPARRVVTARIHHLSWLSWLGWGDGTERYAAGDLVVVFNREKIKKSFSWKPVFDIPGSKLPAFVEDVLQYAKQSVAAYESAGLPLCTAPLSIYVRTGVVSEHMASGKGSIYDPYVVIKAMNYGDDPTVLLYVVAHELFHNVQLRSLSAGSMGTTYGPTLEGFAEFAASRLAQPHYALMGKLTELSDHLRLTNTEKFLQRSLFDTRVEPDTVGNAPNPHYNHGYKCAYFLDFCLPMATGAPPHGQDPAVSIGVSARTLWLLIASRLENPVTKGARDAIEKQAFAWRDAFAVLTAYSHSDFSAWWTRFALFYLLDAASPLRGKEIQKEVPPGAIATTVAFANQPVDCLLACERGPTAAIAEVKLTATGNEPVTVTAERLGPPLPLRVFAVVLPGGVRIGVAHGSPTEFQPVDLGKVTAGQPAARSLTLRPGAGDRLYLLAANPEPTAGQVTVRIDGAPTVLPVLHRTSRFRITTVAGEPNAPEWQKETRTYDFTDLVWTGAGVEAKGDSKMTSLAGQVSPDGQRLLGASVVRTESQGGGFWSRTTIRIENVPIRPDLLPVPGKPSPFHANFPAVDYVLRGPEARQALVEGTMELRQVEGEGFDGKTLSSSVTRLDAQWSAKHEVYLEVHFER